MAQRPTLKQVSESAGVSIFTASRALGDGTGVAPETRARILRVSAELGYVPNQMARNLRSARSGFVGVLTTNALNRFYAGIVAALQRRMQQAGYGCFVTDAWEAGEYLAAREDAFVSAMLEQRAAGVVLTHEPSPRNFERLRRFRVPMVFVDCTPRQPAPSVPSVTTDGQGAGRMAGAVFAASGRRAWVLVAHSAGWSTRSHRERGFRDAAQAAQASLTVLEGGNDVATAEMAVKAWLAEGGRADAMLCTNEPLLNGAMRALDAARVRMPEDLAIIGFDDFDWAPLMTPPVTVIEQPKAALGTRAAELLLAQLPGGGGRPAWDGPAPHEVLQTHLVRRGSCGSGI